MYGTPTIPVELRKSRDEERVMLFLVGAPRRPASFRRRGAPIHSGTAGLLCPASLRLGRPPTSAVVITGATTSRAGVPLITATGVGSARYCGAPRREKGPGCPNYLQKELRLTDGPAEHHVVVLVRQVVAVGHVVAEERAEPPEDAGLLAGRERNEVFLAGVALVIELLTLTAEEVARAVRDVMLFHVEVHRVRPAATAVVDAPGLARADEGRRERLGGVELRSIDEPLGFAAQATALEREVAAGSHALDAEVRLRAQRLRRSRQDAVVRRRGADDDLHHRY